MSEPNARRTLTVRTMLSVTMRGSASVVLVLSQLEPNVLTLMNVPTAHAASMLCVGTYLEASVASVTLNFPSVILSHIAKVKFLNLKLNNYNCIEF